MNKKLTLFVVVLLFGVTFLNAQNNKTRRDTVRTEVVKVTTKYNPKISDAKKIKKNPKLTLLEAGKKKKLNYSIYSAPVASTFIPTSGGVKPLNMNNSERIFDNFVAAGFGNFASPYFEASLNKDINRYGNFKFYTKYLASFENIENTILDSNFSNFNASVSYNQEERYFDWEVGLDTDISQYNWYGVAANFLSQPIIEQLNPEQNYNYYAARGKIKVLEGFFSSAELSISNFSDNFDSNEILLDLDAQFRIPTDFLDRGLNDLQIATGAEFINGSFERNYISNEQLNYSIFTTFIHPYFEDKFGEWIIHLGVKAFGSFDLENDINNLLVYPDVKVETAIIPDNLNLFIGANGGLTTNTFRGFTEVNPFVSPTLNITQTSETYNTFAGLKGLIGNKFGFNISASYRNEEDKPLFVSNNSKSNGTTTTFNGNELQAYEYGNSFGVVYDDVQTLSVFAEINYSLSKTLNIGANVQVDDFSTTNQIEAWNLPTLQSSAFGKYMGKKWYAIANLFYLNNRNDISFSTPFPAIQSGTTEIDSFIDLNLNAGYHFSDRFSAFVKMNNILNSDYQFYNNFTVQGFQVLGGFTYKFDF